jgi:hypothetical protein
MLSRSEVSTGVVLESDLIGMEWRVNAIFGNSFGLHE